jgi:hypothetical protein
MEVSGKLYLRRNIPQYPLHRNRHISVCRYISCVSAAFPATPLYLHRTAHQCLELGSNPRSQWQSLAYETTKFKAKLTDADIRYSDWLKAKRPKDRSSSHGGGKVYFFSTSSKPVLRLIQHPIECVPGPLSPGGKAVRSWRWLLTCQGY